MDKLTLRNFSRHTTNDAIFRFVRHANEYMAILLKTCGKKWSARLVERAVNGVRVGIRKLKVNKPTWFNDNFESDSEDASRPFPADQMERKRKSNRSVREIEDGVDKKRKYKY